MVEKYYCNFFAQPTSQDDNSKVYLSDEPKDLILSYCSMQDLANLLLASHETRDAVYSLVPVFKEIVKCGQYKNMDEFLSDFRDGRPRAHAAIGITQYKTQYKRSNRESRPPRNKWLDPAFKAYDLSAVSFVFQKHLFMNAEKCQDNIYENFKIIKEVYKKQKVGTDLSLDKNVAHYLDERLEARKSKKEVLKVLDILTTSLSGSIEANLILYEAHLTGITTSQGKKLSVLPINLDKAYEYYNKANEIASTLPSFQRGTACYGIGLWRLIKGSLSTYDGDILAPGPALTIINQQWNQAMDAWTEAEEGNRQKAVAHFKKFLMESPLFPRVNCTLKCSSSQPTFFSTTEYYDYRRILKGKERIAFNFLKELYEKDKEGDDQLKPYDEDINMYLRMARYYYFWAGYDASNPLNEDANNATFLFNRAIMIHLKNCDEETRDKFTKQLNAISQGGLIWIGTLDAYEHVLKQLGLGDPT
ncbi:hypothetical protein [Candidatus Paracaedibacter symbiosus]|uniref:hypothetical protein n=1 Tax=Candidatus Paracaedibacter symbiosus TaxID=244582 RepID=UPI001E2D36A2|nr:hypothetical protein [Candidatus Paracaedibacter symbiosus]